MYVQVKFLRDSDLETVEGAATCKTIPSLADDYGRVVGKLEVSIISAANLKNTDLIGKSDAYVKVFLSSDAANVLKTPVVKDNLHPEWNFSGAIPINMLRCQLKSSEIYLDVYDEDNITDELIGRVTIDVITLLENANTEQQQEDVITDISAKGNTNYGTLRSKFVWKPSNDCESVAGMRIPDPTLKGSLFVRVANAKKLKN